MTARAAVIAVILAGCGRVGDDPSDVTARPFVVFARPKLVIDRLGVAVPVPVTVGSSPSPDILLSDSPGVVSVGPGGGLTAHQNGTATIRTVDERAQLSVEVRAASVIRLEPSDANLRVGERLSLRLVSEDGSELRPGAASWYTEAPATILVRDGIVEALAVGSTRVTARYGGLTARASLRVEQQSDPSLTITPHSPRLRVGQSVTFQAVSLLGMTRVLWVVRDPLIAQQGGPATFTGRTPGRTQVCTRGTSFACTDVVVRE